MNAVVAVAAGSALGGVARYLVTTALPARASGFPVGTLVVNVTGGLLLGMLTRLVAGDAWTTARLLLAIGFCGGFTTFSAFSLETLRLLQAGATGRAAGYALASVFLTVAAVWVGMHAGRVVADR